MHLGSSPTDTIYLPFNVAHPVSYNYFKPTRRVEDKQQIIAINIWACFESVTKAKSSMKYSSPATLISLLATSLLPFLAAIDISEFR